MGIFKIPIKTKLRDNVEVGDSDLVFISVSSTSQCKKPIFLLSGELLTNHKPWTQRTLSAHDSFRFF